MTDILKAVKGNYWFVLAAIARKKGLTFYFMVFLSTSPL